MDISGTFIQPAHVAAVGPVSSNDGSPFFQVFIAGYPHALTLRFESGDRASEARGALTNAMSRGVR